MTLNREILIHSMIGFGKKAEKRILIWGPSGNLSHRLDENTYLITGSGAHLGKLRKEDFVVVDLMGNKFRGKVKPSIEWKMHTEIYNIQRDAQAVFHSQPFFTTLVSCTDMEVNTKLFPESMAYIDTVFKVPYNHPGSQELADSVSEKARECNTIILSNHGAICWGKSLDNVFLKTETLEMLCKMIALANVGELKLNILPQNIKNDFLRYLKDMKGTP